MKLNRTTVVKNEQAGGYQLYYLWIMAGTIDKVMIPNDDPDYTWVKES